MEQLKRMIFNYTNEIQVTNDADFMTLIFGLFKENAKTKQINPCAWLYLNNDYNAFSLILEDIVQECYTLYLENKETAFKECYKYVFYTYYRPQTTNRPIENYENDLTVDKVHQRACRWRITRNINTMIQKEYYKSIVTRTAKNLKSHKRVFIGSKQKQQTINKLKQLGIID